MKLSAISTSVKPAFLPREFAKSVMDAVNEGSKTEAIQRAFASVVCSCEGKGVSWLHKHERCVGVGLLPIMYGVSFTPAAIERRKAAGD